jgi:hypothetical protein
MKTLTTLTAVAALVAGISIADAQGSSMSKDKSGVMGSSAQVTRSGKFCVKEDSGALNCQYASLSACKAANAGKDCEQNPKSTTGSNPASR